MHYFISDIHLGLENREKERQKEKELVALLKSIQNKAETLFIVGDLFDYWFEYRRVYQKGYFRTLAALNDLTDKGVKVYYFKGNHDFMHRDLFEKEIGCVLIEDSLEIEIEGKKFFIAHGDGYVNKDTGYKILKKILRNPFLQWVYSLIHPDMGVALASGTSKTSRDYTKEKNYGEKDGMCDVAFNIIDDKKVDYVVFGHLHSRVYEEYNGSTYVNLGTWLEQPCFGLFDGNKFEIINWENNGE